MAKVFITGIAGFLGSHLADAMLALGHDVRGIDNLIGGYHDNVPSEADFREYDCNDLEHVRPFMGGAEIVFHCAATAYEGLSVFSPHLVVQNVVGATTAVVSAAIANRVKRIVHCSSMARYGAGAAPFRETQMCLPQDPYGIGKLAAEHLLRNLCETHGVEYIIAVPHNIIGPRQKYDDPYRNVAAIMINLVLQGRHPIIYGTGVQRRCFSFIDDCLQCLTRMAFQHNVVGEVINIGPDEGAVTINELAVTIMRMLDVYYPVHYVAGRPQEVSIATCSSDKARLLLGYETKTSLQDGLRKMIEYIKERGPQPFEYHLPLEFTTEKTPKTWTERMF